MGGPAKPKAKQKHKQKQKHKKQKKQKKQKTVQSNNGNARSSQIVLVVYKSDQMRCPHSEQQQCCCCNANSRYKNLTIRRATSNETVFHNNNNTNSFNKKPFLPASIGTLSRLPSTHTPPLTRSTHILKNERPPFHNVSMGFPSQTVSYLPPPPPPSAYQQLIR
jgi:hypothetical protein